MGGHIRAHVCLSDSPGSPSELIFFQTYFQSRCWSAFQVEERSEDIVCVCVCAPASQSVSSTHFHLREAGTKQSPHYDCFYSKTFSLLRVSSPGCVIPWVHIKQSSITVTVVDWGVGFGNGKAAVTAEADGPNAHNLCLFEQEIFCLDAEGCPPPPHPSHGRAL